MIDQEVKTKKRIFSKLGYSESESKELVNAMNDLLANYNVHYHKLRNFHWNVKGPDFFDVHEQFEIQYNEAKVVIDDIAERIRVFGQSPFSTMKKYLEVSEIEEADTDHTSMEMVKIIIDDYYILMEKMFDIVDVALEYGDSGTEDMMKGFIKRMEKYHWMMSSFSYNS